MLICLDLEPFFLVISKGSWKLDVCHHLIDGLNGVLSKSAFQERGHVVWHLQCGCDSCSTSLSSAFCPHQLWAYEAHFASRRRVIDVLSQLIRFCKLLCQSWFDQHMVWSACSYLSRLFGQGAPSFLVIVVWRRLLYVPSKAVIDWSDISYWLMSVRLRNWSAIP